MEQSKFLLQLDGQLGIEGAVPFRKKSGETVDYFYMQKRVHSLHLARSGEDFCDKFFSHTRTSLTDILRQYVSTDTEYGAYVVGSIPAGLASGVSDIDLILVAGGNGLGLKTLSDKLSPDQLLFLTKDDDLNVFGTTRILQGLELDIYVTTVERIQRVLNRIAGSRSLLSGVEKHTLGRLGWGWVVDGADIAAHLKHMDCVRVAAASQEITSAFKSMEDACAAMSVDPLLACHLGRCAIEQTLNAYLCSVGLIAIGQKWPSLIRRLASDGRKEAANLLEGLHLLTLAASDKTDAAEHFVLRARTLLQEIVAVMTADRSLRLAFRISPQIGSFMNA